MGAGSLFGNNFPEFVAVAVPYDPVLLQQLQPAADGAQNDEEHHGHDQQTEENQQISAARQILVKNQPDARPRR